MIRMGVFAGVFVALVAMEAFFPKRRPALPRKARWPGAGIIFIAGAVLGRLVLPAGLAGAAIWADGLGLGVFNLLEAPLWLVAIVSLAVMDLGVWTQHVAMHRVPLLWRMHRVHHSDPHIDVVTALRFHPAEILVSLAWKAAFVVAFGIPAWAAFAFEVTLNAFAQFNHANWAMPQPFDRILRLVVVTPDMHRVHHSTDPVESNRNFGFCLSVWDRLFRLYRAQPAAGHKDMVIGQETWRSADAQAPFNLLRQPLRSPDQP